MCVRFLGHKRIKTPLFRIDLEKVCFSKASHRHYVKVARMEKEISDSVDFVRSHATQQVNQA